MAAEPPAGQAAEQTPIPAAAAAQTARGVVVRASLILAIATVASRVLGWLRLVVIGSQFGATRELDAYFAAFVIPDAIFQLVVAGALFTALVPIFAGYRARGSEAEGWRLASAVASVLVAALTAFAVLMAVFAPLIVPLIAPGFDQPTTDLTVELTRIMLLSPIFIGMGTVATGLLNTYDRFVPGAIAPLVYNVAIIVAAALLVPLLGVHALALGVAAGAIAHLAIQLPSLTAIARGRFKPLRVWRHSAVRRVAWLMAPRTLGLAAAQLNFVISTLLASGLREGSVAAFNYAFQLSLIPVGIVGVSIAVALFPTLSRDAALGRFSEVRGAVAGSLRVIIFISAPITALMVVLAEPLTAVFFQYGLFDERSAELTSYALVFFAIGLGAHSAVQVLTRAFYAMHDTRTPVAWAIAAVLLNVPLMIGLARVMGIGGLALAISITATAEVLGLAWSLRRRIRSIQGASITETAWRSAVAAGAGALLMLGGLVLVERTIPAVLEHGLGRLLVLTGVGGAGLAIFVLVAAALRIPELAQVRRLTERALRRGGSAAST